MTGPELLAARSSDHPDDNPDTEQAPDPNGEAVCVPPLPENVLHGPVIRLA